MHQQVQQLTVKVVPGSFFGEEGADLVNNQHILVLIISDGVPGFGADIDLLGDIVLEFLADTQGQQGLHFRGAQSGLVDALDQVGEGDTVGKEDQAFICLELKLAAGDAPVGSAE